MTRQRTPEVMKRIMTGVHSRDTRPEVTLRKALWRTGIRYRKNYKALPGSPDIAITRYRVVVFVDGDFWHARHHQGSPGEEIVANKEFWVKKLKRNVERDLENNDALTEAGWVVLRFWASDVNKDVGACVREILGYIPGKGDSYGETCCEHESGVRL